MFQVLSGDGWASDVARPLFTKKEAQGVVSYATDSTVAFFFVSYILINSVMLLNVVVAVLLVIRQRVLYLCLYLYLFLYACTRVSLELSQKGSTFWWSCGKLHISPLSSFIFLSCVCMHAKE